MAARAGAGLVVLGCGGILVVAYLLCSEKAQPQMDELLAGSFNALGAAILASIACDVLGALLLAAGTRPDRLPSDADHVAVTGRPGWATLLLWLAVVIPLSVGLWFGLLCQLIR